jgi:hypothetical protein
MTFIIYIHVEEVHEKNRRWPYDERHNLQHLQILESKMTLGVLRQ